MNNNSLTNAVNFIKLHPMQIIFGMVMLFIFVGIIWGIITISQPEKRTVEKKPDAAPTAVLLPTEVEDPTGDPIPTDESIQLIPTLAFTQAEMEYKNAYPQVFQGIDGSHAGGIVVTSQPNGATITIKSLGLEQDREFSLTSNAPFKVHEIPVGQYTLSATANGYKERQQDILIIENEILRIRVDMTPVTPTQ